MAKKTAQQIKMIRNFEEQMEFAFGHNYLRLKQECVRIVRKMDIESIPDDILDKYASPDVREHVRGLRNKS